MFLLPFYPFLRYKHITLYYCCLLKSCEQYFNNNQIAIDKNVSAWYTAVRSKHSAEVLDMSAVKMIIRMFFVIVVTIAIPVIAVALIFCGLGEYVQNVDRIYPNIVIAGVDVSWLTREEAEEAVDPLMYDESIAKTGVTIIFPDLSEFTITGEELNMRHDARQALAEAYSIGRGEGFITDTVSFLQRRDGEQLNFDIGYVFNVGVLKSRINEFADAYNSVLKASSPLVSDESIIITKGAGLVSADAPLIFEYAYDGLFESLFTGRHVEIVYNLPESNVNIPELLFLRDAITIPVISAEYCEETRTITECTVGVEFDIFNAASILSETESGKTVTIEIKYLQPDVTSEYLESFLFRDLIGECITNIDGNNNRFTNIALAADFIDGLVLEPGDEFSFNDIVGIRTSARGFKPGPSILNGEIVQSIGGGICQVASTLHSAIRDSGLLITDRKPHSRLIPYLPAGRDAAVAWPNLDYKFKNNTEYPLRIDITIEERTLTVKVVGTIEDGFPVYSGYNALTWRRLS